MKRSVGGLAVAVLIWGVANAGAATILGNFIGGAQQGPSVGGGNIVDIFNAAASTWENAIRDPFELSINYGWGQDPGGFHFLLSQGGVLNRETQGLILVQPQVFSPGDSISRRWNAMS